MPGYKAHIGAGIVFYALAAGLGAWLVEYRAAPPQAVLMGVLAILGALFPDVDTSSKGRHLYYGALAVVDAVLLLKGQYKWAAVIGFCGLLPALGPHRGWTHSWWAMLLVPLPVIILPEMFYGLTWKMTFPYYAAFVSGYLSHLVLDKNF
ncbi:MAG: metal-dependent hydrolase [Desulfovibrionaceae bacterium]|nr:metal-dependent hydrolase [Desulfovibrionaceae bacterium]MBF0512501.1 metal-dependent hydrolase [Desulfovibrionaceae bacterium]